MKKVMQGMLLTAALCAFVFRFAVAQDVSYHETWVLDKAKSTIEGRMGEWLQGMIMVISLEGNNLKLEITYQTNENDVNDVIELVLGGEAKARDMMGGRGKATSQAQWDEPNKTVKMHTDMTFEGDNGTFKFSTDDHFSISEDQQNLILKRTSVSDNGTQNSTLIFKKKV